VLLLISVVYFGLLLCSEYWWKRCSYFNYLQKRN
jgi:hypothetical protein